MSLDGFIFFLRIRDFFHDGYSPGTAVCVGFLSTSPIPFLSAAITSRLLELEDVVDDHDSWPATLSYSR